MNSYAPERPMSEQPPPIERHAAADRFGKRALRTAHDLTAAMADDDGAGEPIVLRRNGPHRSIGALEALIDEALIDEALSDEALEDDERPR
jgi:hypothetical protein